MRTRGGTRTARALFFCPVGGGKAPSRVGGYRDSTPRTKFPTQRFVQIYPKSGVYSYRYLHKRGKYSRKCLITRRYTPFTPIQAEEIMGEAKRKLQAVKNETQWSTKTELVEVKDEIVAVQATIFKPDGHLVATGTCEIKDGDIRSAEDKALDQALHLMGKVRFD